MEVNLLRCLTCGGDLSFIDTSITAKCVYCGSLHSVVQNGSIGRRLAALLILAKQCQLEEKRAEAHNYYNRALELDPTNVQGWIGRGLTDGTFLEHSFDTAIGFSSDPEAVRGQILASDLLIDAITDVKVLSYLVRLVRQGIRSEIIDATIRRLARLLNRKPAYFIDHWEISQQIGRFAREIAPQDKSISSILDELAIAGAEHSSG
jgi:hypothetical protein